MRRITVIGNLTADSEVREVGNRKAINFSCAVNEKYKDSNGEKKEHTFFYNCTIWRESNVAVAEFLTKGTKVFIEGSPEVEVYKTKQGETKGEIKIIVNNLELIGGGSARNAQSGGANTPPTGGINASGGKSKESDLPF